MEKKKTFLSHNSRDKPFVEQVARWLEDEAKIPVWLDKWNLIPGDPWQEDIEKALDESQCYVVFIGSEGIGPWQNEEMRSAMDSRVSAKSIRVIPVLLPGVKRPGKESQLPRFLRGLTWVEFKDKWDEPGALYRLECGIKGKEPGRDNGEIEAGICPFRGLEIFREQDRRFFFGREVLEEQLLDKLADSRFLAVAGPSGSGKSSLVQAGLISSLRPHSQVALFTPGEQPLEELAFALRTCYPQKDKPPLEQLLKRLQEDGNILHYLAREILEFYPKKKLLVVIDQFEELFTQTGSEEMRRCFISLLLEAVEVVNGPVTVILTIRSDFIGKCAFYKELNMFVIDHLIQVEPMGMEELRRAIEKPAHMVGLHFEEGLVNRILEDVKGAPGELPLLEHALLELYDRREGECLSLSAYDAVGGIAGALVNRAESEFNKLDDIEKEILRKMFVLRMIQPGEGTEDMRRRAAKKDLLAIGGDAKKVDRVLNRWINARLLTGTRDSSGGLVLVDVAHEALIRKWHKIREWMEEDRELARLTGILRQAVMEWLEQNRSPGFLFQGARLVQMEGLVKTHSSDLTEDEIEFVKAGAALREAQEGKELQAARELAESRERELEIIRDLYAAKKKTIKRTTIFIIVLFLSFTAITYLFYDSDRIDKEARRQFADTQWGNSRQARERGNLLYSFHLWADALTVSPDPAFRKILLFDKNEFWTSLPQRHIFRHVRGVRKAKFNDDETRILTYSDDGTARLWHAETGKPIGREMLHKYAVNGASFNADETKIITWSEDGTAKVWDIGVDWDYPIDKIKLQVWALTGTRLNTTTMEIEVIEPDEWRKIKKEYMEFAREHYKTCKYPQANVFRKLFPEEAKEIKRTVIGH